MIPESDGGNSTDSAPVRKLPVPAPRKSKSANSGMHLNPFQEPKSVVNVVSSSPEVFTSANKPQVQ